MEETILTLIEKICDKAIEEVGAWLNMKWFEFFWLISYYYFFLSNG